MFFLLTIACFPDFYLRDFINDPNADYDGDGYTEVDGDCDDNQALAYPSADEVCDHDDNDNEHDDAAADW